MHTKRVTKNIHISSMTKKETVNMTFRSASGEVNSMLRDLMLESLCAYRSELRHAEPENVNREAELSAPPRVVRSELLGVWSVLLKTY